MIPKTLEEWSIPIIEDLLLKGYYEAEFFDFKEMLPHSKDAESKERLKKSCCAFANSGGGFLLFGIKDDKTLSIHSRLVGIDETTPLSNDFPEKFGNYPANCTPSIVWNFRNPPLRLDTGKVIHIVYIPQSWNAPHAFGDHEQGWQFHKRTNKGNEGMSYEEVRLLFLGYYEKRVKLQLLLSEIQTIKSVAEHMAGLAHKDYRETTRDLDTFELAVTNSVLVDTYTILAAYPDLINSISMIRIFCNAINNSKRIFYAMLKPDHDTQQRQLYAEQNDFVYGECQPLIKHCSNAIDILKKLANS